MTNMQENFFEKAVDNFQDADAIRRPSVSYWKDVWNRLRKNKLAMVGLFVISTILLIAVAGTLFSPNNYHYQDYDNIYADSSAQYLLGTDGSGRDVFTRLCYGTLISLAIGLSAAAIKLTVGVIIGGIAGLKGGRTDMFLMRFGEIVYAIPYMLLAILLILSFGATVTSMIISLTITSWVPMARLVRGQVLQIKQLEFVQAAEAFGADSKWILVKHLIPNAMGPIIVNVTLTVPAIIFSEATLSYLGLGIPAPLPSLGTMSSDAIESLFIGEWQLLFYPAITICLIMFSFNVLGDGLRDALDPKLRK